MVKTNHETALAIDYIHKIQELTEAMLIECKKWCYGDSFPRFEFSITDDDNYECTMEIYYGGKAGWEVSTNCIELNYKTLKAGIVPFLQVLNYGQDVIKYEDIRKEFGIKEENE